LEETCSPTRTPSPALDEYYPSNKTSAVQLDYYGQIPDLSVLQIDDLLLPYLSNNQPDWSSPYPTTIEDFLSSLEPSTTDSMNPSPETIWANVLDQSMESTLSELPYPSPPSSPPEPVWTDLTSYQYPEITYTTEYVPPLSELFSELPAEVVNNPPSNPNVQLLSTDFL
jgi:hypothetical protein